MQQATQALPTKLNFGCGYDKRPGYLNVDAHAGCEPDILLSRENGSRDLPTGHFSEVVAKDVLEHIERSQSPHILLEWARLLRMGGTLIVEVPSILHLAEQFKANPKFADQYGWTICLYGNQVHEGDYHHTGFTETTLRVQLAAAGFDIIDTTIEQGWLFLTSAKKVSDWRGVLDECKSKSDEAFLEAAYQSALGRPADDTGRGVYRDNRARDGIFTKAVHTREQFLKHLYASPERLFRTAERLGL